MKVKVCPKCGSADIRDISRIVSGDEMRTYECNNCGFESEVFKEKEVEIKEKKKKK